MAMAPLSKEPRSIPLLKRHAVVLRYVLTVIVPAILRTGKRPLIFWRLAGLGDIICTLPAAQELKRRHPGAPCIYNCHPDFATIPVLGGVADTVTSFELMGMVGYWYRFLLAEFCAFGDVDDTPEGGHHEPLTAEYCRQAGVPRTEEHPLLVAGPAARERALAIVAERNLDPDSLILIHPGPTWPVREWPREGWTQLIAKLRARSFTNIGQLGVGRHLNAGQVDVQVIPGAASLLDAFSVEECVAAIAEAKLFIGIDSGLLHIAASTRTPSVGIFGMTFPAYRFSPEFRKDFVTTRVECAGCRHRFPRIDWITGCPYDIRCMTTIEVDEVLQACLRRLDQGARVPQS